VESSPFKVLPAEDSVRLVGNQARNTCSNLIDCPSLQAMCLVGSADKFTALTGEQNHSLQKHPNHFFLNPQFIDFHCARSVSLKDLAYHIIIKEDLQLKGFNNHAENKKKRQFKDDDNNDGNDQKFKAIAESPAQIGCYGEPVCALHELEELVLQVEHACHSIGQQAWPISGDCGGIHSLSCCIGMQLRKSLFCCFSCLGFFCPVMSSSSGSSWFPSGPEFFRLLGLPNESALSDSWANQAPADASTFVGELEAQFGMSVSVKNKLFFDRS